jgi:hypothetical protein
MQGIEEFISNNVVANFEICYVMKILEVLVNLSFGGIHCCRN